MMNYTCPGCHKPIGLIADNKGRPQLYKCPYRTMVFGPQQPVKRDTPPVKKLPVAKPIELQADPW